MKMNLKDIMGTLNRDEMKKIMAGSGSNEAGRTTKCISNSGTVYTCTKSSPNASCSCPSGNSNNACG